MNWCFSRSCALIGLAAVLVGCNGGDRSVLNVFHLDKAPPPEVTSMTFSFQQAPALTVAGVYPVGMVFANGNGPVGNGIKLLNPIHIYGVPTGSLTFGLTPQTATAATLDFAAATPQFFVAFDPAKLPAGSPVPAIYATTIDVQGRTVQVVLSFVGPLSAISVTLSDRARGVF